MRLLICAGGTGGGVYPAMAILQALGEDAQPVLWVGGQGGLEADLVQRANIPFTAIPAAGVHGVDFKNLPRNSVMVLKGMAASYHLLEQFQPEVVLFTGGYIAAPMAFAARRTSTLLFVPDIEPGLALKFLARFADVIAISTEESRSFLPARARIVVTGYPTRSEIRGWDRNTGRTRLGLQGNLPVVLVFGGSKGALSINRAISVCLPDLLEECQVIHITGERGWSEDQFQIKALNATKQERYHAFPYLHEEMGAALASADLVISRAGAATLGEYPIYGLPAILVPYPHAWRYQKVNASYLAGHKAAVLLPDEQLAENLQPLIQQLLHNTDKLNSMRSAMQSLARPQAAANIAEEIRKLAASDQNRRRQWLH